MKPPGEKYQRAIQLFRDNPETLNRIAVHMAEHDQEKGAIYLFQELANASPASRSTMMVNIGNAQLRLGDDRSAANSFREAIETDPENALAYCGLAILRPTTTATKLPNIMRGRASLNPTTRDITRAQERSICSRTITIEPPYFSVAPSIFFQNSRPYSTISPQLSILVTKGNLRSRNWKKRFSLMSDTREPGT